jgi:hypothetical protein
MGEIAIIVPNEAKKDDADGIVIVVIAILPLVSIKRSRRKILVAMVSYSRRHSLV